MPRGKKKSGAPAPDTGASGASAAKTAAPARRPTASGTSSPGAGASGESPTEALEHGLALKEEGNRLFKDGEYRAAIRKYKQGILRTRGLAARMSSMAMFAAKRGDVPLSLEQEAELVRLTQSFHANLSACYLKQSEWDKAVRYAAVVLDSDPGNVKSMLRLGQAYNQLGDLVGADRILTKAASLHTRPDALGKALRETLREVRTKLRGRDSSRVHVSVAGGVEADEPATPTDESASDAGGAAGADDDAEPEEGQDSPSASA